MTNVPINYVAVLVAAVVYMVIGFLWYSPILFGRPWMKLVGMKEGSMQGNQKAMMKSMGLSFLTALVMTYVLAHFVYYVSATTPTQGMQLGFWVWLGFVATMGANEYIFAVKPKPWKLYGINVGYILVSLLAMGAILAAWT